jgi:FixJ family two-component response regulator
MLGPRPPSVPTHPVDATVVLVDDDVALRTALTFMLELDGFTVEAFASGEELLEGALPQAPTCLVLDHNLSGMTGLDTLLRLRARGVKTPAVLITSHPNLAVRSTAALIDAVIVEKPLLSDALKLEIEAALVRHS